MRAGGGFKEIKIASSGLALAMGIIVLSTVVAGFAVREVLPKDIQAKIQSMMAANNRIAANQPTRDRGNPSPTVGYPVNSDKNPIARECVSSPAVLPADLPASWDVRDAFNADLNGDGEPELVLLVWRPWRDLPIQRWSDTPSPVSDFRDTGGDSCHVILIDPNPAETSKSQPERSYREIWAGSPLPVPLIRIAAADVDGDGFAELAALEGDYSSGRSGPGCRISVWRWNGFGFTMQWRSGQSRSTGLTLGDGFGDDIAGQINRITF